LKINQLTNNDKKSKKITKEFAQLKKVVSLQSVFGVGKEGKKRRDRSSKEEVTRTSSVRKSREDRKPVS